MDSSAVPAALRDRLGVEGTDGLVRLFDTAREEWTRDVVNLSVERFERRLVEELATLRVEIARGEASLREELAGQGATLREEVAREGAALRGELARQSAALREELASQSATLREELARQCATLREELARQCAKLREELARQGATLREELAREGAALRVEVASNRFELLKWSFVFWAGQLIAMAGLMALMLRAFGPAR